MCIRDSCIVIDQRLCLLVVYVQTLLNSFRLVIVTKNQFLSAGIAYAFCLRSRINKMIGSSAFQAGASSAHTVYDVFIRNIHINGKVDLASQFLKSLCQTFCLRNGSRKTVKNIAVLCIILLDSCLLYTS